MAKFKVTLTGRAGKPRPTISVVVDAVDAKAAQNYVRGAIAIGAKFEVEAVEERRPTLRAAQ